MDRRFGWDYWKGTGPRAVAFSASIHLALLVVLAAMVQATATRTEGVFTTKLETPEPPEYQRVELAAPLSLNTAAPADSAAASFAPQIGEIADPVAEHAVEMPNAEIKIADVPLPQAAQLDHAVMVQGNGAEHVGGVEGAVDRIAMEILRRLEQGPVLVVWAFDASGSLLVERERLIKHITGVYENVLKLDDAKLSAGDNLLTSVISFGKDRKALTEQPTSNLQTIASAIGGVALDRTGIETTFTAVGDIARRWGKFSRSGTKYQTMAIVVTDEVGDDEDRMELAIAACRDAKMPVYVLGSAAIFGKVNGHVSFDDPQTKIHYDNIPVRQGPESARLEMLNLPFWAHNPEDYRYEEMDSGFGPYALSRLAGATGGIYFVTRMGPDRINFDPLKLREYRPDWFSPAEYEKHVLGDPLRLAVTQAAMITQRSVPGSPGLTFNAPAGTEDFKDAMRRGQETVAKISYAVDQALVPIMKVSKLRERETSKRWSAHYDLMKGRLLAMKLRCYEYNWACAQMKSTPRAFGNPENNTWRMAPDQEIHFSDKAKEAASEAIALLEKVAKEHPDTPWAILAQRELRDPLGFKWVEAYVRPPQRMEPNPPAQKKQQKPMEKPPEPPKL